MMKSLILALAIGVLPALASAEPASSSQTVKVADLDLQSANGNAQLAQRIVDACGEASIVDPAARNAVRACRSDALAKADRVRQVQLARRAASPVAAGQQ